MTKTSDVLKAENVHVAYGKKAVIHDLSFAVKRNETFGFMGLNGAGKTTFIKTALGLRDPQKGEVLINGESRNNTVRKSHVAYLPERFEPPWFLTGIEFIHFSAGLYGKTYDESVIFEESEKLALDHNVLKNRTQGYSKGMRQKLGILATLLTDCALFILDEPMSGLDPKARALVKDALRRAKDRGATIFLSSHILTDMDELCDRVGLLHEGHLVFEGAPDALKKDTKADNMERAFLQKIERAEAA